MELKTCWEPWAPYQYENEHHKVDGIDIELTKLIAKEAGYKLEFLKLPWKRSLNYIEKGTIDFASSASRSPEREEYAYFSEPYRKEIVVLYVRKGETAKYYFENLKEIIGTNFQLGIQLSYYYGEIFEKIKADLRYRYNIQAISVGEETNFKKLIKGRIDGMFVDSLVAEHLIHTMGLQDKVEIHPLNIYACNVHFMFSKKPGAKAIVESFNSSIRMLKKSGKIDHIILDWLKRLKLKHKNKSPILGSSSKTN